MNYTGKIIVLAYPDTFVTMSDEWICKLLPLVGLGTWEYIKAGHAALILINNENGDARYFDFGRYVTPKGKGRVRGANTDAELAIPVQAKLDDNSRELLNLNDFLHWLDANPDKTHGEGRLLASVCDAIDFKKAEQYILDLQSRGSIPYGAFDKAGSNCARFVTDTILHATSEKRIIKALNFNKKFTPSGVGNVEKAALGAVYEVFDGAITPFRGSALRENLVNYFGRKKKGVTTKSQTETPQIPAAAQRLTGIGCDAWFELMSGEDGLPKSHYRIRRYNELGNVDFDGVFYSEELRPEVPFEFTYDSHCAFCHVIQNDNKIRLDVIAPYALFNSSQKVRSA
ncbi:MAG: DUF6695 family protein [Bacteroidota bacterium]